MPRTQGTNPDTKNPAREIGSYNQSLTFQASSAGRGGTTPNVTTNRTYVLEANYQTGNQALYATDAFGGRGSPVATLSPNGRWQMTGVITNPNERYALQQSLNRGNFGRTLNNELQTVATRDLGSNQFDRIFNPIVATNPETGSPSGGTNPPAAQPDAAAGSSPLNNPAVRSEISRGQRARTQYPNSRELKYPLDYVGNDYMTIEMLRYVPESNLGLGSTPESGGSFALGGIVRRPSERGGTQATLATVTLPIPANLIDANLVGWGNDTLKPVEAYFAGGAQRVMGSGGNVLNQLGSEVRSLGGVAKNQGDELKTIINSTIIEKLVGSSTLTRSTGAILNPNAELLFKSPELRSFSFSFKMTPRNEIEASNVKKIVRTLKQGMSVKRGLNSVFLASPNVFKITFYYVEPERATAKKHPYLPTLKLCALQNMSVNYMPDGSYMTYGDGSMVSYDMTLSFGEVEPIFDEDYDKLDEETGEGDFSVVGY